MNKRGYTIYHLSYSKLIFVLINFGINQYPNQDLEHERIYYLPFKLSNVLVNVPFLFRALRHLNLVSLIIAATLRL